MNSLLVFSYRFFFFICLSLFLFNSPSMAMKASSKDKKIDCPECEKSFTRKHNLKTHFRAQHEEECITYPWIFERLNSTKVGKLWPCPHAMCKSGFGRKGDLKFHMMQKHPDLVPFYPEIMASKSSKENKKFRCPIESCKSGYVRNSDLNNHIYRKHPTLNLENNKNCGIKRLTLEEKAFDSTASKRIKMENLIEENDIEIEGWNNFKY